jgi:serine/threonine protein kinase
MLLSVTPESNEDIAIPKLYGYYSEESYNIMILELLGPSLEDLFNVCEKRFSLKTTLMLGVQMLELIKYVHNKDTLHRDIKPDNFLIGCRSQARRVYMIDFGLSRKYRNSRG